MEKELVKRLNKEVADFYETEGEIFGHTRHHVWELMLDFMSRLKSGDVLVDVGAGNARLLDVVPDGVGYVGIEPSGTLREFAKRRLQDRTGSEMLEGGLPKLDLADNTADAVTCIAVLHHVPSDEERRKSISELHRILKPGGQLILSVWNLRSKRFFNREMLKRAWLRIPGFKGGDKGDLYYVWKAGQVPKSRYVHAFAMGEFKSIFAGKDWEIERIGGYDKNGWTNFLLGRNLVAVLKKK